MAKPDSTTHFDDKHDRHDDKVHAGSKQYETAYGSLDQSSTRDGSGPSQEPYWGSGNDVTDYVRAVNHKADIELGLKLHYRQGPDITPTSFDADGTANYEAPSGTQPGNPARAAWNFDFSVNTGIEGSTRTLEHFDFRIVIESGDGERAVFDLTHMGPGLTPWLHEDGGMFADEDGTNPQISQNSVNFGFAFMKAIFGADYNDPGEHYDIYLQAFDNNRMVAQVHDSIDIV